MKKKFITSGVCFALFLLLILLLKTVDVAAVGPEGTQIGLSKLNVAVHEMFGENLGWYKVTNILGYLAILIGLCFAAAGGLQLVYRRSILKVDKEILLLGCLYIVTAILYVFFEKVIVNYRPVIMEGDTLPEASFPSSHTMLACTIYLSTFMILDRYVKNPSLSVLLKALCVALAVVTVLGRLVSGVHWFTDILGGVLISGALLCCFSAFLPAADDGR